MEAKKQKQMSSNGLTSYYLWRRLLNAGQSLTTIKVVFGNNRMKLARVLCVLLTAGWRGTPALSGELPVTFSPHELGFAADRLERLTQVFQDYVDTGQLPGAVVLISRDDKVAYFRAIGYQDRENKIAMATDSIFRIASLTKPIIAVAAMILVEEGKLDLAAPVSQYLPEFKDVPVGVESLDPSTSQAELRLEPQKRPMMVLDLLRHTAGLVHGQLGDSLVQKAYRAAKIPDRNRSLADMITSLSKQPLAHQPGEVWEYSVAYDVLGRIIEVVSEMELDAFIEQRITKPLGMNSTEFYIREADVRRLAEPQANPDTGARPAWPDFTKKPRFYSGGGGLLSTVHDYLRFSEMLMHKGVAGGVRLLAPSTVTLMTANALPPGIGYSERARTTMAADLAPTPTAGQGFGLGFAVRTAVGRNPLPGSVGTFYWTGAWGPTFWIDPREKLIGILMIQVPSSSAGKFRRAMRNLTYQALTGNSE
jgi:CubicO group peptidase (beta-lactamase class C family)